jgi:hypothetical protein
VRFTYTQEAFVKVPITTKISNVRMNRYQGGACVVDDSGELVAEIPDEDVVTQWGDMKFPEPLEGEEDPEVEQWFEEEDSPQVEQYDHVFAADEPHFTNTGLPALEDQCAKCGITQPDCLAKFAGMLDDCGLKVYKHDELGEHLFCPECIIDDCSDMCQEPNPCHVLKNEGDEKCAVCDDGFFDPGGDHDSVEGLNGKCSLCKHTDRFVFQNKANGAMLCQAGCDEEDQEEYSLLD